MLFPKAILQREFEANREVLAMKHEGWRAKRAAKRRAGRNGAKICANPRRRIGTVKDLLERSDLRRPSTGQPQRRSRHAWSCVPWLLAHRRDKLRNEESVPRSQPARADDGAGRISVLSDLNDRGKREF
jgi:hypothetical protein